jgi:hypothetical protein
VTGLKLRVVAICAFASRFWTQSFRFEQDEVSDFGQSGWSKFGEIATSDWFKLMHGWLGEKFRSVVKSSDSETLATLSDTLAF